MILFEKQIRLLNLLILTEGPVSGHVLGKECGQSLNTLKKEIELLNDQLENEGFTIASCLSRGYQIEILDSDQFQRFRRKFLTTTHARHFFATEQKERIHFLLRQLLTNDEKMTISDFAQTCNCSASVINQDMIEIKKMLRQFDLQLENHTNNGLRVCGNEWNKRNLLINEFRILKNYDNHVHLDQDCRMIHLFIQDEAYQCVRTVVLNQLKQAEFLIPYRDLDKLIFMVLMNTLRRRYEKQIIFSPEVIEVHKHIIPQGYPLALSILTQVGTIYNVQYTENEILSVAILLNCYRTLDVESAALLNQKLGFEKTIQSCMHHLKAVFHLEAYSLPLFESEFRLAMTTFLLREQMKLHVDVDAVSKYRLDVYLNNFCLVLFEHLKKADSLFFNIYDIYRFYPVFSILLSEINKQIHRTVFVISKDGLSYSRYLCHALRKLNTVFAIEYIPMDYLEYLCLADKSCDFIVTDISKQEFDLDPERVLRMPTYNIAQDKKIYIHKMNNPFYSLEISRYFQAEDITYLQNAATREAVYHQIETEILADIPNAQQFVRRCQQMESIISPVWDNQLIVLNTTQDLVGKTFIKVLVLDKPVKWKKQLCSIIVLYNVRNNHVLYSQYICVKIQKLIKEKGLVLDKDHRIDYATLIRIINK